MSAPLRDETVFRIYVRRPQQRINCSTREPDEPEARCTIGLPVAERKWSSRQKAIGLYHHMFNRTPSETRKV